VARVPPPLLQKGAHLQGCPKPPLPPLGSLDNCNFWAPSSVSKAQKTRLERFVFLSRRRHDSRHLLALPAEHGRPDREIYGGSSLRIRVAARLLHKGPEYVPGPFPVRYVLPAQRSFLEVGGASFEPATSSL
jgi:hypothetical protein